MIFRDLITTNIAQKIPKSSRGIYLKSVDPKESAMIIEPGSLILLYIAFDSSPMRME
jgi:hypothetical protein